MIIILCGKGYGLSGTELLESIHADAGKMYIPVHALFIRNKTESFSYVNLSRFLSLFLLLFLP